jgi:UDPglucose 6-dehydrogenase
VKLARALIDSGARVTGHDPEAGPNFGKLFGASVTIKDRDYDVLDGAHALVLLTEWRSYRAPNFAEIRRRLVPSESGNEPLLLDARNIWRPSDVAKAGLRYQGIGVTDTTARRGVADRPSSAMKL